MVPRLSNAKTDSTGAKLATFYDSISTDEDTTLKTIVSIDNGITLIVEKTQTFVTFWEKTYEHVWKQDKEAYIRRYEKAMKPLSSFEMDIQKYNDLADEVNAEAGGSLGTSFRPTLNLLHLLIIIIFLLLLLLRASV